MTATVSGVTPDDGRTDPKPRVISQLKVPVIAVAASIAVAVAWFAFTTQPADTVGAQQPPESPYATPSSAPTTDAQQGIGGAAADALSRLAVKGRAAKTGYDRDSFGFGDDIDGDGCQTRDDILARDLVDRMVLSGDRCETESGTLTDPYSGQPIDFVRGTTSVDIDHVVALDDAWVTGAFAWNPDTRIRFANDPLNLLAVDFSLNRQKGSGDAATWLPPLKSYRCPYVARQIAVKAKYRLWVKPAERDAMERILSACPGQPLPHNTTSRPTAAVGTTQPVPSEGDGSRALGHRTVRELRRGQVSRGRACSEGRPGVLTPLDGDGDGTGCDD